MNKCAECGITIPEHDIFCSDAHEDLWYMDHPSPGSCLTALDISRDFPQRGQKQRRNRLPPSKQFDQCEVDYDNLPF